MRVISPRTLPCPIDGCTVHARNNTGLAAHLRQTHNKQGKGAMARILANNVPGTLAQSAQAANEAQVLGNDPAQALQTLIAHVEAQLDAMGAELAKMDSIRLRADKLREDLGTLTTAYRTITATSGE